MYRVSIEVYSIETRVELKHGRTRNAVGALPAGECFLFLLENTAPKTRKTTSSL